MIRIHIINGANLQMLGQREPSIYGTTTLGEIEAACRTHAQKRGCSLFFTQSNHEGRILDLLDAARTEAHGLIINPGAWTHYSCAIADALRAMTCPKIELHLSNPLARARAQLITTASVDGCIIGLGADGYPLAIDALLQLHANRRQCVSFERQTKKADTT